LDVRYENRKPVYILRQYPWRCTPLDANVKTGAAWIREHIKDIKFGRQVFSVNYLASKIMSFAKRMPIRYLLAGIKRSKTLFLFPDSLPLFLYNIKGIQFTVRHNKNPVQNKQKISL